MCEIVIFQADFAPNLRRSDFLLKNFGQLCQFVPPSTTASLKKLGLDMETHFAALIAIFFIASQLPYGLTMPSVVPALMWSPHQDGISSNKIKEVVNYQTISQKDLAKSVLLEGGWSNLLCPKEKLKQPVDLGIVFVGRELHSLDKSGNKQGDPALVDLLQDSFTRANSSMAFPYVAASEEESMENSLMSGFVEICGPKIGVDNVAFLESCSLDGAHYKKLADFHSVHDYLNLRKEKRPEGQIDLVVACHGGPNSLKELDQTHSESEIFSELIGLVEQSGANYVVLYVSDLFRSVQHPSYRELERFLAESTFGNGSANSTFCDELCQIKSSLLEGILVGIVLLIILISGLCCMMGIDTPTRFETPQDS